MLYTVDAILVLLQSACNLLRLYHLTLHLEISKKRLYMASGIFSGMYDHYWILISCGDGYRQGHGYMDLGSIPHQGNFNLHICGIVSIQYQVAMVT